MTFQITVQPSGHQFDCEVRRRHRETPAFRRQQHVGEDRHRLPTLDYADHGLQGSKDRFALRNDLHLDASGNNSLIRFLYYYCY